MTPEEIKALRQALGDTLEQLAHRLGVTYSSVARWERGHQVPGLYYQGRLRRLQAQVIRARAKAELEGEP